MFWGFQKNKYFLGYEYFVIFFFFFLGGGGYHKILIYLGVISMHLRAILKVKVQNGGYFLGGGVLKFQILFWSA